jgi:hypothetical protein
MSIQFIWTYLKSLNIYSMDSQLKAIFQTRFNIWIDTLVVYAVHDYFKHAGGRDIFLLDWRQVLSYDVSFLNICIVVNSVINLVNKNLPRTALQICMFHFNYNFTIIVPNAFNYLKSVTTWEQCSVEL